MSASTGSEQGWSNLVAMYLDSVKRFENNALFGVKREGAWKWLTYGEIGEQVAALRGGLASLGVTRGDRVAVISDNRPEWAIGAYATYGLGAQYVPMYEAQLARDWRYILEDSGTKVLLVPDEETASQTRGFVDELDTLEHVVPMSGSADEEGTFAALLETGRQHPVDPVDPDPSEIAGFIYTSGTTGNPKGVLLSHGNIISNINAVHELLPMSRDDVSLSFLPWAHSFGQVAELHCLLSYGASMGLAESVDKIVDNLAEVRPTLLFSVPRIFNRIYDGVHKKMEAEGGLKKKLFERTLDLAARRRELDAKGQRSVALDMQAKVLDKVVGSKIRERFGGRLRYAFSGGAALSKEVAEFVDALGITVYEGYGLTETSPIATANRPGAHKLGSVGKPIPHVTIDIQPVETAPEGEGEIVVYGPNVMQGYNNRPEETREVITEDGGFRTGDLGRKDEEGFLYVTGRVKEQYKLENGRYVAPAPLEEKLKLSPYVDQVMIDGRNRPYNVAVIVPDLESLRSWADGQGLTYGSDEELVELPEAHRMMEEELQRWSADFKPYERVQRFVLTAEPFTTDNDLLTPTLKLKRRNVLQRYGDRIDALYEDRRVA